MAKHIRTEILSDTNFRNLVERAASVMEIYSAQYDFVSMVMIPNEEYTIAIFLKEKFETTT